MAINLRLYAFLAVLGETNRAFLPLIVKQHHVP